MINNMGYIFPALIILTCVVVGFLVVSHIRAIAKLALVITVAALITTAISLAYSTGRAVVYNDFVQSSYAFAPTIVKKACGPPDVRDKLCYKEIEYRGYPFKMVTIEYPPDAKEIITLTRGFLPAAPGVVLNYAVYLTGFVVLALVIKKLRSNMSQGEV